MAVAGQVTAMSPASYGADPTELGYQELTQACSVLVCMALLVHGTSQTTRNCRSLYPEMLNPYEASSEGASALFFES